MSLKCLRSAGTDRMCNRNWDTNFSEYLAAMTGLDDRVRAATNSQAWVYHILLILVFTFLSWAHKKCSKSHHFCQLRYVRHEEENILTELRY